MVVTFIYMYIPVAISFTDVSFIYLLFFTYTPVAAPFPSYVFGRDAGKIMLYGISCTGSPSRLVDCSYSLVQGSRSGSCGIYEDAGIRCYGKLHLSL